ncbi:MAG: class I SAM-dependent methyltransferase [Salinirussus sp.]
MPVEPYEDERIERLRDTDAFRYCSGEELRGFLSPAPDWRVADLGSGVGLFTDELAPVTGTVYAVDLRSGLHTTYQAEGLPENVRPVTADFAALPFPDNHLDGAISMRTFHHGFVDALEEVSRVLRPGGRLVIMDWSATGAGDREGKMQDHYVTLAEAQESLLEAGFAIPEARERRETFIVVGKRRSTTH